MVKKFKFVHYESPRFDVVQIETEGTLASSYADSYLDYKQNPSMSYGDEEEQWF